MKFIDIVQHVAKLADQRNAEDQALKAKHGLEDGLSVGRPETFAYMEEQRPAQDALEHFLDGLDEQTVRKLEAVMYAGRDKHPFFRDLQDQIDDDKDDAVRTMMEKTPLGDYLMQGLLLAQAKFVDLEGDL